MRLFREAMEANQFRKIVTGHENWFTLELQQSAKWSAFREDGPQRVRSQMVTKKFVLTVTWGGDGFHAVDLMTPPGDFDSQYFMYHFKVPLVEKIFPNGRNTHCHQLHLHLPNCLSAFQRPPNSLSRKITLCLFRSHLTVLILHRRTSGLSVI
jgi:hypothetical protein